MEDWAVHATCSKQMHLLCSLNVMHIRKKKKFAMFASEDGEQLLSRLYVAIFLFCVEKCPKDVEDAEVGKLCGSAPLHPVRCSVSCDREYLGSCSCSGLSMLKLQCKPVFKILNWHLKCFGKSRIINPVEKTKLSITFLCYWNKECFKKKILLYSPVMWHYSLFRKLPALFIWAFFIWS